MSSTLPQAGYVSPRGEARQRSRWPPAPVAAVTPVATRHHTESGTTKMMPATTQQDLASLSGHRSSLDRVPVAGWCW